MCMFGTLNRMIWKTDEKTHLSCKFVRFCSEHDDLNLKIISFTLNLLIFSIYALLRNFGLFSSSEPDVKSAHLNTTSNAKKGSTTEAFQCLRILNRTGGKKCMLFSYSTIVKQILWKLCSVKEVRPSYCPKHKESVWACTFSIAGSVMEIVPPLNTYLFDFISTCGFLCLTRVFQ